MARFLQPGCKVLMTVAAMRAKPLDDERQRMRREALGKHQFGSLDGVEAIGMMARLAIEVQMPVGHVAGSIGGAQLIVEHSAPVLKSMYHIMFKEQ